jgi:hypothetical protein
MKNLADKRERCQRESVKRLLNVLSQLMKAKNNFDREFILLGKDFKLQLETTIDRLYRIL